MSIEKEYDIFISYRRTNKPTVAHVTYYYLLWKGYRVFLDVEGLGRGPYDEQIFQILDKINDLILICPEGALDGCILPEDRIRISNGEELAEVRPNPDDWVYKEVSYALQKGKNVIPLMVDFIIPEDKKKYPLPEKLDPLRVIQSVEYDNVYFGERLARIENRHLKSKPVPGAGAGWQPAPIPSDKSKPPEVSQDDEPLEPEVDVTPIAPSGTRFGRPRYTKEDLQKAREQLAERLEEQYDAIKSLMKEEWISSREAYRSAKTAMILVHKLMSAYDWGGRAYEMDTAREKFENQYGLNLQSLYKCCADGEVWLPDKEFKILRQYNEGLRELIQILKR